ncbi:sensor domain-containing phosphodiesterase [Salsuginibacillus kocurii]|uniref:sensor domain-containing phosphodiesterase n=1 Tax=Salsuginibacillus kocurii TaxID=427078 RepID=UPI000370F848|nr:EAL domain-containing protein [Salsuginibacillus kocurii]
MYIPETEVSYYKTFDKSAEDVLQALNLLIPRSTLLISHTNDTGLLVIKAYQKDQEAVQIKAGERLPLEESFCQFIRCEKGEVLAIEDTKQHSLSSRLKIIEHWDIASYIGAPIILSNGNLFGTLSVISHTPVSFSAEQRKALELMASFLGQTLDLEFKAVHDELTGLYNHHFVDQYLQPQQEENAAVIYLDLDNFKYVNDAHGHAQGDIVLQQIARRIMDTVGSHVGIARISGGQFIIWFRTITPTELDSYCAQILHSLNQPFYTPATDVPIYISASMGISNQTASDQLINDLLKQAELAMAQSKQKGKKQYTFFTPTLNASSKRRATLIQDLAQAIQQEELELFFQGQYDAKTTVLTGYESLLRWHHPKMGYISPGEFIPLAEETGLMLALDNWVLKEACLKGAKLNEESSGCQVKISVNLSSYTFNQPGFSEQILETIDSADCVHPPLELEITESHMLENIELVSQKLEQIKSKNISVAIDDFGKGYSSLNYIKELPIDTLKLDASLVQVEPDNERDIGLMKSIVDIAHLYSLTVIGEGVETASQLETLRRVGCDEVQGFFFSKPQPLAELVTSSMS